MNALAQAISEAASDGRLHGLTLWPCPDGWQAGARTRGGSGFTVAIHEDPVQALLGALAKPTIPTTIAAVARPALTSGVFD